MSCYDDENVNFDIKNLLKRDACESQQIKLRIAAMQNPPQLTLINNQIIGLEIFTYNLLVNTLKMPYQFHVYRLRGIIEISQNPWRTSYNELVNFRQGDMVYQKTQ